MISLRSIKNFIIVNGSVFLFGTAFYFVEKINPSFLPRLILIKHYLTLKAIGPNFSEPLNVVEFFKSTFIDGLSYYIIKNYFTYPSLSLKDDLIYFIPISFIYEVIFDFFFYWSHRILHLNKYLYRAIHSTHHSQAIINITTTFHHSIPDLLLTNTLPLVLAASIVPLSDYTFTLILFYKNITELSGHSGEDKKTPSFVQCIWIPKLLSIALYSKNHCLHHEKPNVNFSKRFSLWDKIFGTFSTQMPKQISKALSS
jgi:sterol desaturase/sphingolipid hydroxylase (fatty acid hydroxylase superfamily)